MNMKFEWEHERCGLFFLHDGYQLYPFPATYLKVFFMVIEMESRTTTIIWGAAESEVGNGACKMHS
jgi:hypothetical protein